MRRSVLFLAVVSLTVTAVIFGGERRSEAAQSDCRPGQICLWNQPAYRGQMRYTSRPVAGCVPFEVHSAINNTGGDRALVAYLFPNDSCHSFDYRQDPAVVQVRPGMKKEEIFSYTGGTLGSVFVECAYPWRGGC